MEVIFVNARLGGQEMTAVQVRLIVLTKKGNKITDRINFFKIF